VVGLTVEIKLRFHISPALCERVFKVLPIVCSLIQTDCTSNVLLLYKRPVQYICL